MSFVCVPQYSVGIALEHEIGDLWFKSQLHKFFLVISNYSLKMACLKAIISIHSIAV